MNLRLVRCLRPGLGALLLAAIGFLPAAGGAGAATSTAAPAAPGAGAPERVLDVTLVPAGAAPQPRQGRPAAPPAGALLGAGAGRGAAAPAAVRAGRPGSKPAVWPGWLGGAAAAMAAATVAGLAWRRRRRRCPSCRAAMRRLDREAAFAELDMAERTEHLVGDVRYEVWRCDACGQVEKLGTAHELTGADARALSEPAGSAAFLRRRAQSGLSIWSPPPLLPQPRPRWTATPAVIPPHSSTRGVSDPPPPAAPSGDSS
jgi:hypothetical protein